MVTRFFDRAGRRLAFSLPVVVLAVAAGQLPATATAPGKDGQIAFKRYLDPTQSTSAIFVVSRHGKGARQLTKPGPGVLDDQPDWSPDGSTIVFQRCAVRCEVWVVDATTAEATRIGPDCLMVMSPECEGRISPAFSPDGQRIAFGRVSGQSSGHTSEHLELDTMNIDGSDLRTVKSFPPYSIDAGAGAWAPDGQRLVLELANAGTASPPYGLALYVINIDGTGMRRLTPFRIHAGDHPDWSPDGTRILFRSRADVVAPGSQLYSVRPDGSGLKQLTHFTKGTRVLSSSFAPSGDSLTVALARNRAQPDIFVLKADGSRLRAVTRTRAWDSAPDWGAALGVGG
jgi:Tol biopolymer transport system component